MLVRARNLMLIFALLAATGAHWAILQSFAWTTMLAQNLHVDSFTEAVTRTFDGKHPCNLCKAIAAGKSSEKKAEFTAPLMRFEFPPAPRCPAVIAPDRFVRLPLVNESAESLSQQPPTPPPRSIFA
jgi:hypothetical protein